jgi:vacuolar-type H+-ATPase subunit H
MQTPQIADQLRAMAASGTRVPGFRGKVMVDIDSLVRMSDQLGSVDMSDDVREASEVIRMKESILNQAYLEAKRIRTTAEEEVGKLTSQAETEYRTKVGESSVLKRAEEISQEMQEQAGYESQQILQDAQRKAYRVVSEAENVALARRDGADSYSREVLFNLEEQLADILGQVRRGIDALNLEVEASKRKQQHNSGPVNGVASGNGVAAAV